MITTMGMSGYLHKLFQSLKIFVLPTFDYAIKQLRRCLWPFTHLITIKGELN
jgi:hypothetical protein